MGSWGEIMPTLYYWHPKIISPSSIAVKLTIRQIISRHKSRLNFFTLIGRMIVAQFIPKSSIKSLRGRVLANWCTLTLYVVRDQEVPCRAKCTMSVFTNFTTFNIAKLERNWTQEYKMGPSLTRFLILRVRSQTTKTSFGIFLTTYLTCGIPLLIRAGCNNLVSATNKQTILRQSTNKECPNVLGWNCYYFKIQHCAG